VCIHPEALPGTHDVEQSGRGAARIDIVHDTPQRTGLARELAEAFLSGPWNAIEVSERGAGCLDRWPSWMETLAMRVVAVHRAPPADRPEELVTLIEGFLAERPARGREPGREPPPVIGRPARRQPAQRWPIAEVDTVHELGRRLELGDGHLAWLADVRALERTVTDLKLRNYRYQTVHRRGGLPRVIEAPKARLKEIQRWVLEEILLHVPPHPGAHGFTRGRSVRSHAGLHTAQAAVLRLDLKDFFASITAGRVYGTFRTLGYPPAVAHVLTGLCTNTIPGEVWRAIPKPAEARLVQPHFWLGRALATPHLPQGAPTSPALANLAAFRMDRRLAGLAASIGLRYSRYADDLTFSGSTRALGRSGGRFQAAVAEIVRDERFALNPDKCMLRTAGARQTVCGVVVNVRPNVTRAEYDTIKAILHNAVLHGPQPLGRAEVSDLQAHLRGRIAWVASLNPDRGRRLRRRFDEIDWGR
jgi:RNA-directed DNA polymerase